MIKCTVCQKIYKTEVEYCDCGNDMFEQVIADIDSDTDETSIKINAQQLLSCVIFAACLGLSGWVLFGIDSPRPSVKPVPQTAAPAVDKFEIPSIDKIWDDTPAYYQAGNPLETYKLELQNVLSSNIYNITGLENGECEIEFNVNSNGKLINRKIYKKLGGTLFNNEVISMIKSTTSVPPPPAGCDGVQYRARVYTENGVLKVVIK